jgi:hypothetical protein
LRSCFAGLAADFSRNTIDTALAVGYLEAVTAQRAALTNERTAIEIARRRLDASVPLVKALGGSWDTGEVPPEVSRESRPVS